MSSPADLLEKLDTLAALSRGEAETLMEELLAGQLSTEEIVRMLEAINRRAVTSSELAGFARVMRRHASPVFAPGAKVPSTMVDLCGTGGDASGTFNISTAAALVAAGAGAVVAKHGNRAVSSRSGSADVLEALGVRADLPPEVAGESICNFGIGFLFAPAAHSATRHAVPARKLIGRRTVFNLLGPLTNPAGAQTQVAGIFSSELLDLMAETLADLGVRRAMLLHGAGGLDEISPAGETRVTELQSGAIRQYKVSPDHFGLATRSLAEIRGGTPAENAELILKVFQDTPGAPRDVVVMNAAAALVVTEIAKDFRAGARLAEESIRSGAALDKLERLRQFTQRRTS